MKYYVAGHRGMVGSAILRQLQAQGAEIITRTHAELNLVDQAAVRAFFEAERPDAVILAAAKVGGIHANNTYPAEFIYENLMMEANVINSAYRAGIQRLLFLGSSCIYPRLAPQPMREDALLTGTLEATNEPYAVAKIAGIKLCESYNRQYGTDYRSVMPTNLYGTGDNFHPENSHVLPALMRRFHEAARTRAEEVVVWGSGTPPARIPTCRRYGGSITVRIASRRGGLRSKYATYFEPHQRRHRHGCQHQRTGAYARCGDRLYWTSHLRHFQARWYPTQANGCLTANLNGMDREHTAGARYRGYVPLVSRPRGGSTSGMRRGAERVTLVPGRGAPQRETSPL